MTWPSFLNQKFDIAVSTSPLPGIGSGRITSNADRRSLWITSNLSSPTAYMSRTLPRCRNFKLLRFDSNSVVLLMVGIWMKVWRISSGQFGQLDCFDGRGLFGAECREL